MKQKESIISSQPKSVAFIMDGNRRWAREMKISAHEGHFAGYEKFKEVVSWCNEANIETLVFYAFSTENWNRNKDEVSYLLNLFENALAESMEEYRDKRIRLQFIGEIARLPKSLQQLMEKIESETQHFKNMTVVLAISYGGRSEIVAAANRLVRDRETAVISEEQFQRLLWTAEFPDLDMLVRTGGEKRISNFLPWQLAYAELFFTDTHWPAFSRDELNDMFLEFTRRARRHGK